MHIPHCTLNAERTKTRKSQNLKCYHWLQNQGAKCSTVFKFYAPYMWVCKKIKCMTEWNACPLPYIKTISLVWLAADTPKLVKVIFHLHPSTKENAVTRPVGML